MHPVEANEVFLALGQARKQALRQAGKLKMPPNGKLSERAIADLTAWVNMGAPWPKDSRVVADENWKTHWAFQPVRKPELPVVKDLNGPATALDRFILAGLEKKGIQPNRPADRRTLPFHPSGVRPPWSRHCAKLRAGRR